MAFYPIFVFGKKVRRASKTCQQTMAELTSFLHETLVGKKIVKAFCAEEYEKERFAKKTLDLFRREMKAVRAKSIQSPVMEFLAGIGIGFIIW